MYRQTRKSIALMALVISGSLLSCNSDNDQNLKTQGKAHVAFDIRTDAKFTSRALDENAWTNISNYTVEILDEKGQAVGTYKANAIPATLELSSGTYTVHAYYGEEHAASRVEFLSECKEEFAVNINDEIEISLTCVPTCGKAVVNFGSEMSTYFDDYYVTFSTPMMDAGTEATWAKEDTDPWYLGVSENGDQITATIHLTPKAEYIADLSGDGADWSEGTVVRTYTLKRNKAWALSIDPKYTTATGELAISISVDDSTNDQDIDIVIPSEWITE